MLLNSTPYVCLNFAAAALIFGCFASSIQAKDRQLVLVYNSAPLGSEVVLAAEREVSRIFGEAAVNLTWLNCPTNAVSEIDPCRRRFRENPIFLQLTPTAGAFPNETALAHAAVAPEGGIRAVVFFDRVQKFMAKKHPPCSMVQMLGHIMAHEMGHLLLNLHGHTPKGIMAGPWRARQLRQAAEGTLLFTPSESAKMRTEVTRRVRGIGPLTIFN
jgi:hypothetical protein